MICFIEEQNELKLLEKQLAKNNTIVFLNESMSHKQCWYSIYLCDNNDLFLFEKCFLKSIINIIINFNLLIILNNINIKNLFIKLDNKKLININSLYYSTSYKSLTDKRLEVINTNFKQISDRITLFKSSRFLHIYYIYPITLVSEYIYEKSISYWKIFNEFKESLDSPEYNAYNLREYNFENISNNGLYINKEIIKHHLETYPEINKELSILNNNKEDIIHFQYKIDSSPTGRVACSYKNINLMALDKSNHIREIFTSRFKNGKRYQLDFDSFHLRIASYLSKVNLPLNLSANKYIASKFLNKDINKITNDEYNDIKTKIFKLLYGSEDIDINFDIFKKIYVHRQKNVLNYTTILKRSIQDQIIDKSKKYNYFVQKFEVDYVNMVIYKINKLLKNNKSKLALYQYDAIVLDVDDSEEDMIENIKKISETQIRNFIFPVNVKYGNNFNHLKIHRGE